MVARYWLLVLFALSSTGYGGVPRWAMGQDASTAQKQQSKSTLQVLKDAFENPVTPIDRVNATDKRNVNEPVATNVPEESGREDPFSLEGISRRRPEVAPSVAFRPSDSRPIQLPAMQLRGIGRMQGDTVPTALIDIKGFGLFVVTEDDTISLQGFLEQNNVLRIVEISDISVTVEAGSFGELIVVR